MPLEFMNLAFALPNVGTTLMTILGIGLVIFVHELGHFLCAKKVGVRVEVFSLGFGPRLCGFKRGPTDYRISAVPVGGYVKLAGDLAGEGEGAKDELLSRSVGERALIYSGGVLMNVLFALIVFPIIFYVGVPMIKPEVGIVTPGGPAWKAGLEEGDTVLAVNGREVLGFADIVLEVALGDPDNTRMLIGRDGEEREVKVRPEFSEAVGTLTIEIGQPTNYVIVVDEEGAAARAGLKTGDRIVRVDGEPVSGLNAFPQAGEQDSAVVYSVEREGDGVLDITVRPDRIEREKPILGIQPAENLVKEVRGRYHASSAPLRKGDRLLSLDGKGVLSRADLRSIMRGKAGSPPLMARVLRAGEQIEVAIEGAYLSALLHDVALSSPLSERDAGVAIQVIPESEAAKVGLLDGSRILSVNGRSTESWDEIVACISAADGKLVTLLVKDGPNRRTLELAVGPTYLRDFGFSLETSHIQRRYGMQKAFLAGMRSSWNLTRQAYLTLRKMVARQVSAEKNLGGIVAISTVSYRFAERGIAKLFYFLALLSLNLAVINLLPIPVLDGGHIVFLAVEKIKGSPVNDRVMGYSQVIGLMLILSLLIFVTYNDIMRLLP
ncbi:MAG: RIP metalloprotease RseP [Planctomycetota bacterium]